MNALLTQADPFPSIPQILKNTPNWVLWKLAIVNGKYTKVPYKLNGTKAASTRPEDWSDYNSVVAHAMSNGGFTEKCGIGFVVTKESRLIGIDLDGCRNSTTGEIAPWAMSIINAFYSYAEVTPSQTGARVWLMGDFPADTDKVYNLDPAIGHGGKVKIEVYDHSRYFTLTGQPVLDAPIVATDEYELLDVLELVGAIRRKHPAPKKSKAKVVDIATGETPAETSAAVQITKLGALDTTKYDIFMTGTIASREPFVIQNPWGFVEYPSQSEADYAFAAVLAYHHKGDREKMSADFRESSMYREKWDRLEQPTFDKILASIDPKEYAVVPVPPAVPPRAITQEEIDACEDEEFPVILLGPQSGPYWDDEWMYGIAGTVTSKAAKCCEAHPAGMYLDLLVSLGSIIGRGPYFNVGATRHHTNEFVVRVGDSSISRKGTGRDAINEPLKMIDGYWYTRRVLSGFGSGEAIVGQIADPMQQKVRDKKSQTGFSDITKPGVEDKRLCIREGEAASVFQLAGKKESRADIILRDGWDGMPLQNLVKGVTEGINNSASCQEPHLSFSGDTTRDELKRRMPDGAEYNGFANRFVYPYVYRVKMCPNGGPQLDWTDEVVALHKIILWARTVRFVPFTKAAAKVWNHTYIEIEQEVEGLQPLARMMCARGTAHVRRFALILALLDMKDKVDTCHLKAARDLWGYCLESARFIFGDGTTKEQLQILGWMGRNSSTVTLRQVTDAVFHRHRKVEWVKTQLDGLVAAGRLSVREDVQGDVYSLPVQGAK